MELERRRTRAEEESLVTALVLNLVAEACGVTGRVEQRLESSEAIQADRVVAPAEQQDLLAGRVRCALAGGAGQQMPPKVVLCGRVSSAASGSPPDGRVGTLDARCGSRFEMSIQNVDKPPLDFMEISTRGCDSFCRTKRCGWTQVPTFVGKGRTVPQRDVRG